MACMLGDCVGWLTGWTATLAGCFLVGCAVCSLAAMVALAGCEGWLPSCDGLWLRRQADWQVALACCAG